MIIPKYIALQSKWNNKYLRYTNEEEKTKGFLKCNGENVVSPCTKFEVERAKCDSRLVHIRCCYNNKYWVIGARNDDYISATAHEREEDRSKSSCTLFEPRYNSQHSAFCFVHVHRSFYACVANIHPPEPYYDYNYNEDIHGLIYKEWSRRNSEYAAYVDGLHCRNSTPDKDLRDLYTIIDWETLLILPKHVAFKSDEDYYLMAIWQDGHQYLQFSCNDIGDQRVPNETFMTTNGCVRIKSEYYGKFWRRDPNWIWADSDDTSSKDPNTLFWPVRLDGNHVALRCLGNNNYLKRVSKEWKSKCLNADTPTITRDARLKIEEPVISRSIYNVNFRLSDARIYDERPKLMATETAINRTSKTQTVTLKFTHTETKTSIMESSTTWKLAAQTNLKAGFPFIADAKISVSGDFSRSYKWGDVSTSTNTLETTQVVSVPPMSMVEVILLSTEGHCDVPFSYTQRDVLSNGKQDSREFDDGIYTGINCYHFKYESKEIPL